MAKVLVSETNLTAIGNAIREKNGESTKYKPGEMAAAISAITTGGSGGDFTPPVITGHCASRFINGGWDWYIEEFGDQIKTKDITDCNSMFRYSSNLNNIPFEINCKQGTAMDCVGMFGNCGKLTEIPKINNCKLEGIKEMFVSCSRLRYLPEDIASWFDWSGFDTVTVTFSYTDVSGVFNSCYSLRSIPMGMLKHENPVSTSAYSTIYSSAFGSCYALDEIVDLPVHNKWSTVAVTSNMFSNTFNSCFRLKNMTFETNEDGTPKVAKWKSQVIDLSTNVGWTTTENNILNYNSGITSSKKVESSYEWAALKNDPDWFSDDMGYSRYNLDSAIATINSLPDTSAYLATAGGTNTIKFKGKAGQNEAYKDADGNQAFKSIKNLTEEQIAVATAKGWTVTLA